MTFQHSISGQNTPLLERLPEAVRGAVGYGCLRLPDGESGSSWRGMSLAGRLVELSGGGATAGLTLAIGQVAEAQGRGENVAWITASPHSFFPPDAAACGVDLAALPVVRVTDPCAAARAALHLVRCGAFALVVVDLGEGGVFPTAAQARLARLVERSGATLLFLTRKGSSAPSLGPLISLRLHARRGAADGDLYPCRLTACKDRRRGPGWQAMESFPGPPGLGGSPITPTTCHGRRG
ncbi:MAG: recombinase A [Nitrospirota bacterium]|jgi:recombination protein RecA